MLESLPEAAQALHERYTKLTHGPGSVYMYKPLLHHLLPPSMDRALVLDTDLYLPSRAFDLAGLWDEFEAFPPEAALGLALEQQPTYEHLGGGFNGGVQLLHLARMRTHRGLYERELERCATGACGDIGYLGDQTFYSEVRKATPSLFHALPCGWNLQLSTQFWNHPRFMALSSCEDHCRMVHGNEPIFKRVLARLQSVDGGRRRATCEEGEVSLASEGANARSASSGFTHMSRKLLNCCCHDVSSKERQRRNRARFNSLLPDWFNL